MGGVVTGGDIRQHPPHLAYLAEGSFGVLASLGEMPAEYPAVNQCIHRQAKGECDKTAADDGHEREAGFFIGGRIGFAATATATGITSGITSSIAASIGRPVINGRLSLNNNMVGVFGGFFVGCHITRLVPPAPPNSAWHFALVDSHYVCYAIPPRIV